MKSKYILYTCTRGEKVIEVGHYKECIVVPLLDYVPRGLITFSDYKIMIPGDYETSFRKEDLASVRKGVYNPTENRIENRWAVEQLTAYYGRFSTLLRR